MNGGDNDWTLEISVLNSTIIFISSVDFVYKTKTRGLECDYGDGPHLVKSVFYRGLHSFVESIFCIIAISDFCLLVTLI